MLKEIIKAIKNNKRFLVTTHVNPDPDALCSELAIAAILHFLGKNVSIINNEEVPIRFRFLPGINAIRAYREKQNIPYDCMIIVDCGDLNRIGKVLNLVKKDKMIINIDHHITNNLFGDVHCVNTKASSTAEILYDLLKEARCPLTKKLALYLYVGIMTDTGSFRYENTTGRTHLIAGELMKYNIPANELYRKFYETVSLNDLKLFTKVINRLEALFSGKVVCVELHRKILSKFSQEFDLRDMTFKFLRSIKAVEVIIIFTEMNRNETRVNLRSTNKVNVAKVAHFFKGGGHRRASGCLIRHNIQGAKKRMLNQIRRVL